MPSPVATATPQKHSCANSTASPDAGLSVLFGLLPFRRLPRGSVLVSFRRTGACQATCHVPEMCQKSRSFFTCSRDVSVYLSRYIIQNKDDYYRLLLAVTRDQAWEEWILFVLNGLRETASNTLRKVDEIQQLQTQVRDEIRSLTTAGSNSDLLDVLFENPYCRISNVIERCGVSRPTATAWLNALVQGGTLVDVKIGRDRLFINARFFEILARYEPLDGANERPPTLF